MKNNELPDGLHPDTLGVRAGQMRTGFEETAEPMFLNSGYVYESAEAAEASFDLLVRKATDQYKPWFDCLSYRVATDHAAGGGLTTEATVKLNVGGNVEHRHVGP